MDMDINTKGDQVMAKRRNYEFRMLATLRDVRFGVTGGCIELKGTIIKPDVHPDEVEDAAVRQSAVVGV